MSFTIKNLREVYDAAAKGGFGETQEARFAHGDLDAESTGLSFHRVKPGKRQAFAHKHENAEEVYVVISGSGRIKIDDEVIDIQPLDAIRVSPGAVRQVEGGEDGVEYLAFGPRHDGDGELIREGFWD